MSPNRILHVFSQDGLGGTEMMSSTVLPLISRSRFSTEVAFRGYGGPVGPTIEAKGLPVHYLGTQFLRHLIRLARHRRFDVVHFYGFKVSVLGRIAFSIASPSTIRVMGIRGLHIIEDKGAPGLKTHLALLLERALSLFTHHYVANSKGAIEFLSKRGIERKKFHYIPNGLDPSKWPETNYETNSPPVIVCVARMVPLKRHADLLTALSLLAKRGVALTCDFIGGGPEEDPLKKLAKELELGDRVHFLGTLKPNEAIEAMRRADLFVLASDWEGMSRSLMEAMVLGLPVVGTNVNGIRDLVAPNKTGLLVPRRDPSALADAIERLTKDFELRRRFGQAGRQRIAEGFSLDSVLRQLEQFYESVAPRRSAEEAASASP